MSNLNSIISLRKRAAALRKRAAALSNPPLDGGLTGSPRKGNGVINRALAFATKMLYKPDGWKGPNKIAYPAGMPAKPIIAKMVDASYDASPPDAIGDGWSLIHHTSTLKFYKKGEKIIVAVRGTASRSDVYADLQIIANGLNRSARYISDVRVLKEIHAKYPDATFYGCGHSLGGGLCDLFIKQGLITSAVTYNPAVEKSELKSTRNYRIYMANDPLLNLGQYGNIGEVRKQPALSPLDSVSAVQSVKSHLMSNFKGGGLIRLTPFS